MRAFLAVVPPPEVREHLDAHLQPRRDADGPGGWRWTLPELFHLTLAFVPDLPDHLEEPLAEELATWAARRSCLPLALARAGAFPDPGRAKVLWVGVQPAAAREELARWARAVRSVTNHVGARVDGMRFSAHLTVARSGRPVRAGRWVQALDAYRSPSWEATEVVLVASHLGEGPRRTPRYEVRQRFALSS